MRRYITSQLHTRSTRSGNGQERRHKQHLTTMISLSWTQQQLCHFIRRRQSACRSACRRSPKGNLRLDHNHSWIYPRNSCSTYSHIFVRATSSGSNGSTAPPSPSSRRTKPLSRERSSGPATLSWRNVSLFRSHSRPSTQNTIRLSSRPNDKISSPSTRNPTSTSSPLTRLTSAPA